MFWQEISENRLKNFRVDGGKWGEEVVCFHFCSELGIVEQNCRELCEGLAFFEVLRERLLYEFRIAV